MNFELLSFGGTLAIGFAAVMLVWFAIWILGQVTRDPWTVLTEEKVTVVALLTVTSIASGICIESLSDSLADQTTVIYHTIWRSDHDHKIAVLFEPKAGVWRPTMLGHQIAAAGMFARAAPDAVKKGIAQEVQELVRTGGAIRVGADDKHGRPTIRLASRDANIETLDLVRPAYYEGKAAVFREPGYAEELTRIQQRIDFGRSWCFLGAIGAIIAVAIILGVGAVVSFFCLVLTMRIGLLPFGLAILYWMELSQDPRFRPAAIGVWRMPASTRRSSTLSRSFIMLGVSIAMYFIGGSVYSHQEDELDKRVFGYHHSLLQTKEAAKGSADAEAVSLNGVSGLTSLVGDCYLAVLDTKGENANPRLMVVDLGAKGLELRRVELDASSCRQTPSDLESIVRVSRSSYLACESWSYQDPTTKAIRPHRLFELEVVRSDTVWRARVTRFYELAWGPGVKGNIEGLLFHEGRVFLFDRGEGGTVAFYDLPWPPQGSPVTPTKRGQWSVLPPEPSLPWRGCSDLVLVDDTLVGLATSDTDRPFDPIGTWSFNVPVQALSSGENLRILAKPLWDGLKGEALCRTHDGRWLIGTDDEEFGGSVRLVRAATLGR
jgi:hypothetical protein